MKALPLIASVIVHALLFFILARVVIFRSKLEENPPIEIDVFKTESKEDSLLESLGKNHESEKFLEPKFPEFVNIKKCSNFEVSPPHANKLAILPTVDFLKIEFNGNIKTNSARKISTFPAKLLKSVLPKYPASAIKRNIEGTTLLEFEVDKFGVVKNPIIVVSSGHKILDIEAINAIRKAKFDPAILDGTNVSSQIRLPIEFKLNKTR